MVVAFAVNTHSQFTHKHTKAPFIRPPQTDLHIHKGGPRYKNFQKFHWPAIVAVLLTHLDFISVYVFRENLHPLRGVARFAILIAHPPTNRFSLNASLHCVAYIVYTYRPYIIYCEVCKYDVIAIRLPRSSISWWLAVDSIVPTAIVGRISAILVCSYR